MLIVFLKITLEKLRPIRIIRFSKITICFLEIGVRYRLPEKVTFSDERMTFSREKVVFRNEKMTFSGLKVTLLHINMRINIQLRRRLLDDDGCPTVLVLNLTILDATERVEQLL